MGLTDINKIATKWQINYLKSKTMIKNIFFCCISEATKEEIDFHAFGFEAQCSRCPGASSLWGGVWERNNILITNGFVCEWQKSKIILGLKTNRNVFFFQVKFNKILLFCGPLGRVSIIKFLSWSKMTIPAPATMSPFQWKGEEKRKPFFHP